MISPATAVEAGAVVDCDVCIVGGGPAGITIAQSLAQSAWKVLLLESGGLREDDDARDLLRGHVEPAGSQEPLEENRRRQFGGASVAWGGRCVPLDDTDFERRDWIAHSGWPIPAEAVRRYLPRALALCEAGAAAFDAKDAFPDRQREMIAGFDGPDVVSSRLERWGPPTNFAARYGPELARSDRITVLTGATVVRLGFDAAARTVRMIDVAAGPERGFGVRAGRVVLACGGLENARLLLSSDDVCAGGIGNHHGNVGRYYMSHPGGVFSYVRLARPDNGFIYEFERHESVYVRRRFWITAEAQRRARIGNAVAFFFRPFSEESLHGNALMSAMFLTKHVMSTRSRRFADADPARTRAAVRRHLGTVVRNAPSLLPQLVEIARQRFLAKRRLPMLLPRKQDLGNRFELWFQTEHAPNPESRVVLHHDRDRLGVRRLEARIRFGEIDRRTIVELHRRIADRFDLTGTGRLVEVEPGVEQAVAGHFSSFNTIAHHIGTTRMSADAADGVVDTDSRVHGTTNLYIAGASVFPTAGHANPTLTIVALALRLAHHLRLTLQTDHPRQRSVTGNDRGARKQSNIATTRG